jgi:membrane protein DedA with SNARE-associated domain
MKELFLPVIDWYMQHINYFSVCLLMTIESSFIPFPSELVVPPAAWKAAQGDLNMALVLVSATLGAIFGALINYFLARTLGRKVVYSLARTRLAHMLLIKEESVEKAEKYFLKHGVVSTFIGRLIPAIRQLISLPAGLAKMRLVPFVLFTTLGALIWNVILAIAGYFLYTQKEVLDRYFQQISIIGAFLGVVVFLFLLYSSFRGRKPSGSNAE